MARVLLVDHDEHWVSRLRLALARAGCDVESIPTNGNLLETVGAVDPDLVICHTTDGLGGPSELPEVLIQDPVSAAIPTIFVGESDEPPMDLAPLMAEAHRYIGAPRGVDGEAARILALMPEVTGLPIPRALEAVRDGDQDRPASSSEPARNVDALLQRLLHAVQRALALSPAGEASVRRGLVESALTDTLRLHYLLRDLVFISRLDEGDVCSVREVLSTDLDVARPIRDCIGLCDDRHLDVCTTIDPDAHVHACRYGFALAVHHLVDNACRYGPEGGRIDVHLAANGIGGCVLTVRDEGPGIPEALRDRVFDRHYQIGGDDRRSPGLGVGLTIARAFARAHGGDVTLLDTDRGCGVRMSLPPAPADVDWGSRPMRPLDSSPGGRPPLAYPRQTQTQTEPVAIATTLVKGPAWD